MTTLDRAQTSAPSPQPRAVAFELTRHQSPVVAPPPTFGAWSPVAGAVSRLAAIQVSVTDPNGFSQLVIWAMRPDGTGVSIYAGAFSTDFDAGSSIVGTTTKTITIAHDAPGWTTDYTLYALAQGTLGTTAQSSSAYTLTDPPPPPVPDTTPPTVTLISPPAGSQILPAAPIVIEVTDATGLSAVVAWAEYGGVTFPAEVIHDGVDFKYAFGTSTRIAIAGGYRYTVRRRAGWPSGRVDIKFRPVDDKGNTP